MLDRTRKPVYSFLSLTLQRVSGQAQLADDVSGDVGLHQLSLLGVVLRRLQQMVKLFRVELLSMEGKHLGTKGAGFLYSCTTE